MNSKVSFVNFNYLKENLKKSRGVIYLILFIVPIFTYLTMLIISKNGSGLKVLPNLSNISIPTIIGMYLIPFVMATTLFNFVFKRESVDFINALPMKKSTVFITNIVGGVLVFFATLLISTIVLVVSSLFFDNLIIPSTMYFHYFITFFITYIYVFIISSLAISLTGSRLVHVALTLILLFIPGYLSDFYYSRVNDSTIDYNYYYPTCDKYDNECPEYEIRNNFVVGKSFRLYNEQTLPYKYINVLPRAVFSMYNGEALYNYELQSVYNFKSIIKMIVLSVVYFILGLYAYINRKMEVAESTFKNEHVHQFVKCLTLFPLSLGGVIIAADSGEYVSTVFAFFLAITMTLYVVYDLVTRRNSGNFMKSTIYFLGLILVSILTFYSVDFVASRESTKKVLKEDVVNIGIQPNNSFGLEAYGLKSYNFNILDYKIKDQEVIDLIFDNVNKKVISDEQSTMIATRVSLKNGSKYYFNVRLVKSEYDKLINLLDKDNKYTDEFKYIPYDNIYGVKVGDSYLKEKETSKKIIELIKEGYKDKSLSDIINHTYVDLDYVEDTTINYLSTYKKGIQTYTVNSYINPKLANYIMGIQNKDYIKNIYSKNINVNRLHIWLDLNKENDINRELYYNFSRLDGGDEVIYRYINEKVTKEVDLSKYDKEDVVSFTVYYGSKSYHVFLPKDDSYDELFDLFRKEIEKADISNIENEEV